MIAELVGFGTEQILLIVVVSFVGIISVLFGFIMLFNPIHVYEPIYMMGPVGFEPTTASAPGLYLTCCKMVS